MAINRGVPYCGNPIMSIQINGADGHGKIAQQVFYRTEERSFTSSE